MMNLFSSFDPSVKIFSLNMMINWISIFISVFFFPQMYWLMNSQLSKSFLKISLYLEKELSAVFGKLTMQGTIFLFISIFFFILFSNFMGLIPYIFTSTSHLSMTLVLALPVWLGSMIWSIFYQYNNLLAHLVPVGTPSFLMPIMVIIETISNIIRPMTLSIRLAANMVAGHLLLTLLGSQGPNLMMMNLLLLMIGMVLLLLLEVAVACIQSYVFTILSSLYLNELMSNKFNKFNINYNSWCPHLFFFS